MGGVAAGVLLLLGIVFYRRQKGAVAAAASGASTSPETGLHVAHAPDNTFAPPGYNYVDKNGAVSLYHANYGFIGDAGNSGTGKNGAGEVSHELESPVFAVAELGSGEIPGKV